MCDKADIGGKLLKWYDAKARVLPWRVPPGEARRADPYTVWLSEIMLQQTTVVTVGPYFEEFLKRWPTVHDLAAANDEDVLAAWAGLGYYARARNLLKCARVVAEAGGVFPDTEDALLALPGIGPYTAAAIASIAFGVLATVVDGNIERVMARLFDEREALPAVKPVLKLRAASLTPEHRAGDHAQALMDLGATICIPKNPRCALCPLHTDCAAYEAGSAKDLPKRAPKKPKPNRLGIAYFAKRSDGHVLLETRPPKGLLGGMRGLVGSDWAEEAAAFTPPFRANWQKVPDDILHVFTHFNLALTLYVVKTVAANPQAGEFVPPVQPTDLPSIMRKAYIAGAAHLDELTS